MTDPRSDSELLSNYVAGDTAAFEELYDRHRGRLWAVALRTTGDPEEAADALQEAMVSVLRNAHAFRGDAAVTSWLHRIVVNASLDRLRRKRSRAAVSLPDHPDSHAALVDQRDRTGEKDTQLALVAALAALPEEQRVPIVLVDMEGYPVAEVAQMLGVPSGTIKSRCSRGRAKLATQLQWLRGDSAGNQTGTPTRHTGNQWPLDDPAGEEA